MRSFKISNIEISEDSPAFVIAEIGHNHQGDLDLCKTMFKAAKDSGASAVKLQKRSNKNQFTTNAYNAPYNSENSYGKTYGEHREFLEFNKEQYLILKKHAHELELVFFSTAFDKESVDFLIEIDIAAIKIASGDIINHDLLAYASNTGIPLIVSTGASTIEDINHAVKILKQGKSQFALLQCTSGYPAKYNEINLRVINTMMLEYPDIIIGLSSHENGISIPVAGYALGARIIEKHFTIDRTLKGTDQAFSLSSSGMTKMCRDLNRLYLAMGDGDKKIYESEIEPMKKQRKSIVANKYLKAGTILKREDLDLKCPNIGIQANNLKEIIGKKLKKDYELDAYIKTEDLI